MPFRRVVLATGLVLCAVLALGIRPGRAEDQAAQLVNQMGQQVLQMLNDKSLAPAQRTQRFHSIVDQDFDFPVIARFVLGRSWQTASEADRQKFARVFEDYMVQAYASRFSDYSGQSLKVTGERAESERTSIVTSEITQPGGNPPVKVDWRVTKTAGGPKITDVSISGVSMALTYRDQFASAIQRNGGQVSGLIAELQDKVNSGTSTPPR
jgi:phospholipid transport system substrate-binding protein